MFVTKQTTLWWPERLPISPHLSSIYRTNFHNCSKVLTNQLSFFFSDFPRHTIRLKPTNQDHHQAIFTRWRPSLSLQYNLEKSRGSVKHFLHSQLSLFTPRYYHHHFCITSHHWIKLKLKIFYKITSYLFIMRFSTIQHFPNLIERAL